MTTNNDAMRVSSQADIDTFVSRYVLNNPDRHVATLLVKEKEWAEDERSFMTMAFTKLIRYGEHFRLIARNIRQDDELRNICVDIIASNDQRLARTDNHISAYLQTNRPESHQDEESDSVVPTDIYRFSFYTQDVNDAMTAAPLSEQLQKKNILSASFSADDLTAYGRMGAAPDARELCATARLPISECGRERRRAQRTLGRHVEQ